MNNAINMKTANEIIALAKTDVLTARKAFDALPPARTAYEKDVKHTISGALFQVWAR